MLPASVDSSPEGSVTAGAESSRRAAATHGGGAPTKGSTHRAATAVRGPRWERIAGALEAVFEADERRQAVAQSMVVEAEQDVGVDEQAATRVELEPHGARDLVLGAAGERDVRERRAAVQRVEGRGHEAAAVEDAPSKHVCGQGEVPGDGPGHSGP